ncbi:MAG TPA: ABC transporter ATP-binding protein [Vicinamibacterales bacterium]|nr:ABC transporter ATP-binding protein [Vicinamibacterales bacterium]
MSGPAIRVRDLVKVYSRRGQPDVRALDGLTFDVQRGAIFGLLGPNGAGKTTLLRILSTLARPTSGSATVLDRDVVSEPLEVRRRISVVIQESAAELFLTVRDNLGTFARFHGLRGPEIRKRSDRILEEFGLAAEATRKVMDLSGGFRRRVQVAKVFMVDTPVVFLDEFSTGMDPILKRSVMDRLRREAAGGRTLVLTTQVLGEAEELCDDILIINRGRQAARGDLHTLKLLSQGVYDVTVTFDRLPPGIEEELAARHPIRLSITQNTIETTLKEDDGGILAVVGALASRGRVLRLEVGGASLEDIFVELTKPRIPADREPRIAANEVGGQS